MRQKPCKALVTSALFLLIAGQIFAGLPEEVKKQYHKEYITGPHTILSVTNKYGDVNLINWNKDSLVIDVVVTIDYPAKFKGKPLIEYIHVSFSQSGNKITAETQIDENSIERWYSSHDKKKFSIDYTIHAPTYINFQLLNKYGDVFINELSGQADLEIRYGFVRINKLSRGNIKPLNTLTLAYSKGTIEEAGWLMLEMKYSKLEIKHGKAIAGDTKYSHLQIDNISSVVFQSKYDEFRFGTVNNLVLVASYGDIKAGEVRKKISLETRYTGVEIDHVPAGFISIDVDNAYGGVKIRIDPEASYYLKGSASYCKMNYPEARVNRIVKNNSSEVSGLIGTDKNSRSKVTIQSKYGSVSLH